MTTTRLGMLPGGRYLAGDMTTRLITYTWKLGVLHVALIVSIRPSATDQPRPPSTYPMGIHDTVTRAIAYLIKEHLLLPKNSSTMCLSEESSSQKVLSTDLSYQPN